MPGQFNLLPRSLSARLLGLMTLALLPLGLISLSQTWAVYEDAQATNRASLMAQTIASARDERELIQEAFGAAETISATLAAIPDRFCEEVMTRVVNTQPSFLNAEYTAVDGGQSCSSSTAFDSFSKGFSFDDLVAQGSRYVSLEGEGQIHNDAAIVVHHPVWQEGALTGFVSIAMPHRLAAALLPSAGASDDLVLVTLNGQGQIVAGTRGVKDPGRLLPQGMSAKTLIDRAGYTFVATAENGNDRFFALTEIVEDQLIVVGSWPAGKYTTAEGRIDALLPLAFPFLMWMAGILVAYVGVQLLVLRHLSALRSAMRRFALGERKRTRLNLSDPPEELAEAERAFNRMATIITNNETRIEQELQDKEVLLREVHHRVKNNLQLMASIMNMQGRMTRSSEAQTMLAGLQRRVQSLALLHRRLYTSTEQTTVNAHDMIEAVAADISALASCPGLQIETCAEPIELYPDQAVPFCMLLGETLTNAVKYVGTPEDGEPYVWVSLDVTDEGQARLMVQNSKGAALQQSDLLESGGLGTRLIKAFVRQLGGEQEVEETDSYYRHSVVFANSGFAPDETPPQNKQVAQKDKSHVNA